MLLNLHVIKYHLLTRICDQMMFNRYQIPPNFKNCKIHHYASLLYDKHSGEQKRCPCCDRIIGRKLFSLCKPTQQLIKISEELPLFYSFIKTLIIVLIIFTFALMGEYIFSRDYQKIYFVLQLPDFSTQTIQIGFVQRNKITKFILFIIFTLLILFLRAYLKKQKYQAAFIIDKLSDRSVMLNNVHPQVTVQDIKNRFSTANIEHVVLTYRVSDYNQCLISIYSLQKQKLIALKKKRSINQIKNIDQLIYINLTQAEQIYRKFRDPSNKLDIAFLTFGNSQDRNTFLKKYSHSLIGRLFFKLCSCCSSTAIHGRHINVINAPQPQDIDWLNLQQSYWRKKINRIACVFMCCSILIYGILFQYQVSIFNQPNFEISIIKTVIMFIVDYFIMSLLILTTQQIEKHQLNTSKILSLVKKFTFFIFVNLSMSPLIIYIYYQFIGASKNDSQVKAFDNLSFSLVTISIVQFLNFQRIKRWIRFHYQKSKDIKCQMTQQQANNAFEPIPFPLASFYSLLISSFLMTAFFVSCYQYLIVTELIAACMLFVTSKYMLLRVCKQPTGLKNQISALCQRLLTYSIYIYWIGEKVMYYCIVQQYNQSIKDYIFNMDGFTIAELAIMISVFLFSSKLLAFISHKTAEFQDIRDSLIQQMNRNANRIHSYEEINSITKLQQQYEKMLRV